MAQGLAPLYWSGIRSSNADIDREYERLQIDGRGCQQTDRPTYLHDELIIINKQLVAEGSLRE